MTPRKIPAAKLRELAYLASCDERTVARVYRDPTTADRTLARQRAAAALRAAGLLPAPRAA